MAATSSTHMLLSDEERVVVCEGSSWHEERALWAAPTRSLPYLYNSTQAGNIKYKWLFQHIYVIVSFVRVIVSFVRVHCVICEVCGHYLWVLWECIVWCVRCVGITCEFCEHCQRICCDQWWALLPWQHCHQCPRSQAITAESAYLSATGSPIAQESHPHTLTPSHTCCASFSQEWTRLTSSAANCWASINWPIRTRWFPTSSISLVTWSTPGKYPLTFLLPSDGNFEEVLCICSIRELASETAVLAIAHNLVMWLFWLPSNWSEFACLRMSSVTWHCSLHWGVCGQYTIHSMRQHPPAP